MILKVLSLLIIATLVSSYRLSNPQEEIAEKVIEAFRNNNPALLEKCFPLPQDFKSISKNIKEEIPRSEFLEHYENRFQNKSDFIHKNFQEVRLQGDSVRIIWSKIKMIKVQSVRTFEKNNVNFTDILINLKSENRSFILKLDDCMLSSQKGWLILDEVIFQK